MTRFAATVLLCAGLVESVVAQDCPGRAAAALEAEIADRSERFALPGRPEVFAYTYSLESCVAFLAVSRPEQDLNLRVLAPSGLELARDTAPRAWAYASHCGVAGQRVHAVVSTPTRGQFELLVLRGAPPDRPDLGRRIGACFAGEPGRAADTAGHHSPPEDEGALAGAVERIVEALGWPAPRVEHGRLRGGRSRLSVGVEAGRCYLVVVRSSDPTVVVEGRMSGGRWTTPPHRRAVLRECPSRDARLELLVAGGGDAGFAVGIAELPRPAWGPPSSAGAAALAPIPAEPELLSRFHLRRGDRIEVELEVAECVTLAAVPADGDLSDLRLSVEGGPSDPSPDPASLVHLCAAGTHRVELRAARGGGMAWLLGWPR